MPRMAPDIPPIIPGSCWRHRNGFTYIVLAIGNDYPDPRPGYPPMVNYCNRAGKLFNGRADDWHRRMVAIEPDDGLFRAALVALAAVRTLVMDGFRNGT